jgi:site-specific recombinase XerD
LPAHRIDQLLRLVSTPAIQEEVTGFLIDKEAQGLAKGTLRLYRVELGYFCDYLIEVGVHALQDVAPITLRRWLIRLAQTRNPGGVHVSYRVLKTFFRWCWLELDIESPNPITKVRPPKVVQQPLEPVPLPDLQAMLRTCERRTFTGDRDRALLLSLLDTGCRASESVSLNLGDVNMHSGGRTHTCWEGG